MQFDLANPGLWLGGSLALIIAATNAAWRLACLWPRALAGRGWPALVWLVGALFLLLPPVAAWRSGALSPYFMGLAELDWLTSLGSGGPLLVTVIALLSFGWLVQRRVLRAEADRSADAALPMWRAIVESGLAQWHWAFYRAIVAAWLAGGAGAPLTWLGQKAPAIAQALTDQPLYWGAWLGLLLAACEWALNPFGWADLRPAGADHAGRSPGAALGASRQPEARLRGAALALITAALFALTRNFWLCLACHLSVEAAITGPLRLSLKAAKDG